MEKNQATVTRAESWIFWKDIIRECIQGVDIRYKETVDGVAPNRHGVKVPVPEVDEDGNWIIDRFNYVHTNTQRDKAKDKWRSWRRSSVLEQDAEFLRQAGMYLEQWKSGDENMTTAFFVQLMNRLTEKTLDRHGIKQGKYEKSIGIDNRKFADERRQRAA